MFELKGGLRLHFAALALVFGLSGCGGGGGVKPAPSAPQGATEGGTGSGDVVVAGGTTLTVAEGDAISKHIVLGLGATLDNAGTLGGTVSVAVEGDDSYSASNTTVLNHGGGSISATDTAVLLHSPGIVKNSLGGVIDGGQVGVALGYGGQVDNDGTGSVIRSDGGTAIQIAIQSGVVQNTNGGTITGASTAVDLRYGGTVTNDGGDSAISSSQGTAIKVTGESGTVKNTGGAKISGEATAIYLQHGGSIANDAGSIIEAVAASGGDCTDTGACAVFVASDGDTSQSAGGELTLVNAGAIFGNVQMIPTAFNAVTLSPGSSIHGDLDIGTNHGSSLELVGDAGSVQTYSQAVTGKTTFAGDLSKSGDGTWIIDSNDLAPDGTTISGGTLQVGNGGTTGSIGSGNVVIYHGKLVFDRSDDVTFGGMISSENSEAYDGTLVQAGTGKLTLLPIDGSSPSHIVIQAGTLQIDNTGDIPGSVVGSTMLGADIVNDGSLVFDSSLSIFGGGISGTGSVTQNGSADLILQGENTYSGGTTVNSGVLLASDSLPGSVTVSAAGTLGGYSGATPDPGVRGVAGKLANAGKVLVRGGDGVVGGNYVQASTGTLAVNLGSKLDVAGTATLGGGTLEITGADAGYVSNAHTDVLVATGGINGTFGKLIKDSGVVFTSTTIQYDANSVWLNTSGLDVTTAAAGHGVSYTPASMGGALRVQGAFEQLDDKIANGNLSGVSGDFLRSAAQFQQSPTLQAAQASLQSLSGQLHAASAAMTFEAIDASSRALSGRFDNLLDKGAGFGAWTHNFSVGGDMARTGFDGIGFQLNGWLVGSDRQLGRSGVAGFAFGQSQGRQQLNQSFDHDNSRNTESMMYAGWFNGNWYTQGHVGFGHFQQDVSRQVLLGDSMQGVGTHYASSYDVAYDESGLHFGRGQSHVTPFVDMEYARIGRDGFAEQGGGGFGLRSNAQMLDRWQAGLGVRAAHHWDMGSGHALDFDARVQWQRTLASHGDVFDASFVGLQQWQPLDGIGLSRYSGLLDVGLNATLSAHTALKFDYDYEMGQRDHAQELLARLNVTF